MRTSKLGMLYDKEQNIRPDLDQVVSDYISEFEAFITFKEKLPIYSSPVVIEYTSEEIDYIISKFLTHGCVVTYSKTRVTPCRFVLTELN